MRKWMVLGLLLAAFAVPAHAEYVFDPADLPEDFECSPDGGWDERPCEEQIRWAAWRNIYGDRSDYWHQALLFDPATYFAKVVEPLAAFTALDEGKEDLEPEPFYDPLGRETPNLADAIYSAALNPYQDWAFAINEDAQLQMVRMREDEELTEAQIAKYSNFLPTSLAEQTELLSETWAFEEADLTSCDGAIAHLLKFPAHQGSFWSAKELKWMPGYTPRPEPDAILVSTDGYSIYLRGRGVEDSQGVDQDGEPFEDLKAPAYVVYDQSNGGAGYDWALAMETIVRPCLKASSVVPPWEKLLAATDAAASAETPAKP